MSASTKMDPPPVKAELVNDGGRTSGITSFRGGKLLCHSSQEGGVRICERNTGMSKGDWGGGAAAAGTETPLQPMDTHGGPDIHLQPWRTPQWSRWMPKGAWVGSPSWSRLVPGPEASYREEPKWKVLWQEL
ncbi:hypothetical protein DUI87_17181 [Hirundo rustica rustica]|uniref:Uncharacterized protein n=1 Tax=Hirundo rustica rustica TaxID=333673 RepID=A0A3M0K8N4_HIRRU|nr:hypothetical protein DUI87_17181 [Hirundo rustica rustica]